MTDDFVTRLAKLVLETCGDPADDVTVRRCEIRIRQQYGGDRIYIRRTDGTEKKTLWVGRGIAAGLSLRDAFAAAGVSRSAGYRALARRWHR